MHEDRVINSEGKYIYVDPEDGRGRKLIENGGALTPRTIFLWDMLISEEKWTHVIDVGANYGEMLVSCPLPSSASIVAIEPNPEVRRHLVRTLREADLTAEILDVALSDTTGIGSLMIDRSWSGKSHLARAHDADGVPVRLVTLASVLTGFDGSADKMRVLVKIDVEGHEAAVLRGASEILPALGQFSALVEVLHGADEDLDWIEENFDIVMLKLGNIPEPVSVRQGCFRHMLASGEYYSQDVILRRREP